jgi:hypothetical protein
MSDPYINPEFCGTDSVVRHNSLLVSVKRKVEFLRHASVRQATARGRASAEAVEICNHFAIT